MLSLVYKASRRLMPRKYPTRLVFKDGSSIMIRWEEPRQILKIPLTLEELKDDRKKMEWQIRRRVLKQGTVSTVTDDVTFDATKYLRNRKK